MIKSVRTFPWWYNWVKWVLPTFLALSASIWFGLTLTATIPTFSFLQFLPSFFSTLEGFSALTALTIAMGAVASMVTIASVILVRALLFSVLEDVATENQVRSQDLLLINRKLHEFLEKSNDVVIPNNAQNLEILKCYLPTSSEAQREKVLHLDKEARVTPIKKKKPDKNKYSSFIRRYD